MALGFTQSAALRACGPPRRRRAFLVTMSTEAPTGPVRAYLFPGVINFTQCGLPKFATETSRSTPPFTPYSPEFSAEFVWPLFCIKTGW